MDRLVRARKRRWWSLGLYFLLVAMVFVQFVALEIAAQAITLSLSLGESRSLIMTGAFRSLDVEEPGSAGKTIHEVRLRVGREDAAHDTYAQLLDLTIPLSLR